MSLKNKFENIDQRYSSNYSLSLIHQDEIKSENLLKQEIDLLRLEIDIIFAKYNSKHICTIDDLIKMNTSEVENKINLFTSNVNKLLTEKLESKDNKYVKEEINKFKDKFQKAINTWKTKIEQEIKISMTKRSYSSNRFNPESMDEKINYSTRYAQKKELLNKPKNKKWMKCAKRKRRNSIDKSKNSQKENVKYFSRNLKKDVIL